MKCDKDIHLPTDKENAGGAGVFGSQKEFCKDTGSLVISQAIILLLKKKKTAEGKMINVGWTARPSSILLSSLFGRH